MTPAREVHVGFRGRLGKFSLDAEFTAPATGITMLFGPSGCGKTTVLRCIAGLIRIKDGLCEVAGEVWQDRSGAFVPTHRRALGYVFQEASLFPHLSVRKNLLFGAPPRQKGERPQIAFDEVTELLGIGALLERSPRNLSGGERQRVGFGRALLTQPRVLLMDEPLSALDRRTKGEILPFIEKLRDHFALPIFYVTHDMAEVERLANQMVLLDKGHVVAAGALSDLQADPNSPLAKTSDAAVTLHGIVEALEPRFGLLRASVRGGHVLAPWSTGAIGDRLRLHIRATDVSSATTSPGPTSILNVLPARIIAVNGADPYEILATVGLGEDGSGARLLARVTRKSWEALALDQGQAVFAQVKSVAVQPRREPDFAPTPQS